MKIILAITTLLVPALAAMAPADAVLAQQVGRAPIAPPPRSAPVVPIVAAPAPTALSAATPPSTADASATVAGATGPAIVPPAASPPTTSRPIVPPTQTRPSRGTQTSLLVELEAPQATGRIAVAIYRDADSFRRSQNPVRTLMLDRKDGVTSAFVVGLPPGRYVIAAFQDVDGDGKLSKGNFGIPREPFGFSNNARARFGLPGFDAAAFELTTAGTTQRIVLRGVF